MEQVGIRQDAAHSLRPGATNRHQRFLGGVIVVPSHVREPDTFYVIRHLLFFSSAEQEYFSPAGRIAYGALDLDWDGGGP